MVLLPRLKHVLSVIACVGVIVCFSIGISAAPLAQEAEIANDEGGTIFVRGDADYTFPYFSMFLPKPYIVLYDTSGILVDRDIEFYPSAESQAFGTIITDPFTSPFQYEIALPTRPNGKLYDVDQDGGTDKGVMIFSLVVVSNTWGDPFLEERDNFIAGILNSVKYSTDIDSFLEVQGGTLLVYAQDDKQGFPSGFGEDGLLFTEDDPIVTLLQGYTLVDLNDHDVFVFDRSAEPDVPLLEAEDAELDDFSDESFTDSFKSMIDLLKREYAFTELKDIDWDALYAEFLPQIEDAEAGNDTDAFQSALYELSLRIPDGHVSGPLNVPGFQEQVLGGVGMAIRELDNGEVRVSYMVDGGPADLAGIKPRAEILEVNGKAIQTALAETRLWQTTSTAHNRRLEQLTYVIRFPIDESIEITFRNPDDDEIGTAEMTTVYDVESLQNSGYQVTGEDLTPGEMPIEYIIREDGFAYVKIYSFTDDLPLTVSLWERFIQEIVAAGALGVVIDMRENGGGSGFLGDQLPAYFFDDEYVIGMSARYSESRNDFVINPAEEDKFILPANELYYAGPVAVIISPNCASACESFSFAMTVNNRAAIVGNYPTAGLGGSVVPIELPNDTTFNYTNSRSLDANGEIAIEGKGVQPTVRVPVTEETLFSAEDVLLNAALDTLRASLNFVALGSVTDGEVVNGEPVQYRLQLKKGEQFSIEVRSQNPDDLNPVLRLYVPGTPDPILEDVARRGRGVASLERLTAPFDLLLIIEVSAEDNAASSEFELEIFDDAP